MLKRVLTFYFVTQNIFTRYDNIKRKKYGSQTPFTSELWSAEVKDSGIFYFSGIGIAAGERNGNDCFNIQRP